MPIEANYETYYGIKLTHYKYSWGGNTYGGSFDDGILVRDHPDEYLISKVSTNVSEINFLYPRLIAPKAYIDGIAEGHFTLYNMNESTVTDVDSYVVTLKKTADVAGAEETLGAYSNTLTSDNSVPTADYLTLPFYIPITEQLLEEDEKLLLNITFVGGASLCFSHENDSSVIDVMIKIPFASEGG